MRTTLFLLMLTGFAVADDKPKSPGYEVDKNGFLIPTKKGVSGKKSKSTARTEPEKSLGPTLDPLVKALRGNDPRGRVAACQQLAALGSEAQPAASNLCEALLDPNDNVRTAALVAIEIVDPDLYAPLTVLLVDNSQKSRVDAVGKIGALGEAGKPAFKLLATKLIEPGGGAQMKSALFNAIKAVGGTDAETVKLMRTLASPGSPEHRHYALLYMFDWTADDEERRKSVVPLIDAGFKDDELRMTCVNKSGEYGQLCKHHINTLRRLKLSSDAAMRKAASEALKKIENGE